MCAPWGSLVGATPDGPLPSSWSFPCTHKPLIFPRFPAASPRTSGAGSKHPASRGNVTVTKSAADPPCGGGPFLSCGKRDRRRHYAPASPVPQALGPWVLGPIHFTRGHDRPAALGGPIPPFFPIIRRCSKQDFVVTARSFAAPAQTKARAYDRNRSPMMFTGGGTRDYMISTLCSPPLLGQWGRPST